MNQDVYLALDIGGTKFMAAAFSQKGEVLRHKRADTPKSLEAGLALLIELARNVSEQARIIAIGASCGGPLNHLSGIVSPLHMPQWRDVALKQIMEKEFGVPFVVDVDTNAAALAEYKYGEQATDRLLYITLSTGMGGGFIVDGTIYRGTDGSHPEVGHQAILAQLPVPGPVDCPCGAIDCLEAIVSGTAIQKLYKKPAQALLPNEWDQVAFNLGQGLRNLAAIYAPAVIVLGGGVSLGGGDRLLDGARAVLIRNLKIVPVPTVKFSKLGYDTALWGGFALVSKQLS